MQQSKKQNLNKKVSQKVEKRLVQAERVVENQFKLGQCTQKYAGSLADPFSGPADACLPITPSIFSRKVRTFVRTIATLGVSGAGFACMQPLAANDGATAAGSIGTAAAYVSTGAYAGTLTNGIPVLNPATTGVAPLNHNGDYPISQFGPIGVQCRLVSMGLRIRYSGTELNRGGRIILYEDPEHGTIATTGAPFASLMANDKAREFEVTNKWLVLCQSGPVMPSEYDFLTSPYTPYGSSNLSSHYLLCAMSGTSGNTFDIEFFWNWEFAGQNIRGKTRSEADDLGFQTVLGAVQAVPQGQIDSSHPLVNSQNRAQTLSSMVNRYAAKNSSGWITKTIGAGKAALPYIKGGAEFARDALPYLEAFL